uniref:Uncharacterized protein n=1 Tax=Setaria digitata TaxID=48799 RepID=A0A915PR60_9BILA
MAESLEGRIDMDCDKEMDWLSYSKEQFDKFVHDYRELAEPSTSSSYESDTPMDAALKRDFINVERKLRRAFYAIRKLPGAETLDDLRLRIESMLEIFKMLKIVKEDSKEEFNLRNVPLPDYDPMDIELLLGKEFVSAQVMHKKGLSKFEDRLRQEVIENTRMGEVLLKECDEIVHIYKEKGDPIMRF